ncbi:MAG: DUF6483 family protein [Lachnospiraceae bacterium]|nr:DUF6483 family protein [Lachnospiraceae bacterium]
MSMVEKDYIMRLIYELIRMLIRMIFHIDIEKRDGPIFEEKQYNGRYENLTALIDKGAINEAENQLMKDLNVYERRDLELALCFYAYLNEKDNDFLETHDYSRREIAEGIKMVCQLFGYESMVESLTEELDLD